MDASELLKRYAAGEREFPNVEVRPEERMNTDLSHVYRIQADLS